MTEAEKLEFEIMEKTRQLAALRREEPDTETKEYTFQTTTGQTGLSDLFAGRDQLMLIHNMGQGCRYCTLWADGINGVLDHLEDALAVVLVSKDSPDVQRRMALDRGWKFRMASHLGGDYMAEHCAMGDHENFPGAAIFKRKGRKVVRRGRTFFGPGDLYAPVWHFLALAGVEQADWTPRFHYWRRPEKLDDGGEEILE
jgi:predicted dithiol-disulfide oxidoreductase (DUF899 family)